MTSLAENLHEVIHPMRWFESPPPYTGWRRCIGCLVLGARRQVAQVATRHQGWSTGGEKLGVYRGGLSIIQGVYLGFIYPKLEGIYTKTHTVSFVNRSFSGKESYNWWLFCGKRPATGRAASGGALSLEPPRATGVGPEFPRIFFEIGCLPTYFFEIGHSSKISVGDVRSQKSRDNRVYKPQKMRKRILFRDLQKSRGKFSDFKK